MPTVSQKGDIDPPDEVTSEAVRGFLTGAFRSKRSVPIAWARLGFGSVSILAHMILMLPHPFKFSPPATAPSHPPESPSPSSSRPRTLRFSKDHLRSKFIYGPLEGFSEWLSPTARVYRGLTPQFKVFLQIAAMTLGGCIWAERRVNEYIDFMRKVKRAERLQAQRVARFSESE
ncbi:hypothetical protein CNMCM8980_003415 [Aspergillus fumigatiaffinis]|nr:hypothetical protein CNMCM5878_009378 [Aspergillus fumigatiaffinis]KAF4223337.1 hypothetical protein CNMCM6457_000520 [Aspergillus fumigatiaffinis]KAF4251792.1 hypothetical protein CNMCM8980_003415 [Aspergillus fumigatiaffinis]